MEKLLKGNSAVRTAETFVAGAAAMKLLEVGCIPLMVGVVAFVATTIWIVKSIKSGKGNLTRKAKVLMAALATISTIALLYGIYHKVNCHNVVAEEATNEVVTENTEEPVIEEEKEESTEDVDSKVEAGASNAGKVVTSRGYCPQEDRIEVTYGNVGGNNSGTTNSTSTGTTVVDPTKETLHVKGEDKNEGSDGIISETGKTTPKKEAEEKKDSKDSKVDMDKENAEEVKSEESKTEENKAEEKAEEAKKSEEVVKATDEDLDNMLKQTEEVETTPEMEVVEIDSKAEEKVVEEPAQKDEIIEEVKPEEKAIEVEAVDGYTGNINSTMQFKISGTNVKIEGLDGISYTFENEILNINTGAEATVLTIEVSNAVNTVTFDVIVNGVE